MEVSEPIPTSPWEGHQNTNLTLCKMQITI
jgi:hypothetical protein